MAVKDVFDPDWLLNPAKVFPLDVSETRRTALAWPRNRAPETTHPQSTK